jgi:hypothetical protein
MSLIHDSEREDFVQCIVAAKLNVVDFELTEQEDEPGTIGVAVWTGTVTVTYEPTGISRTYKVSTWSADFEDDLKSNVFKTR